MGGSGDRALPAGVRPAEPADVALVRRIGVAAGRRFAEVDDPRVARCADDPPIPAAVLDDATADGRLLVATDGAASPDVVGFLLTVALTGSLHVEELAVSPEHERRGHGSRLLDAADARAADEGRARLTLTTFDAVPWNRPYYERRGFCVLDPGELDGELLALRAEEARHGLVPEIRVVMGRPVDVARDSTPWRPGS